MRFVSLYNFPNNFYIYQANQSNNFPGFDFKAALLSLNRF
jgi:hypothetical protein